MSNELGNRLRLARKMRGYLQDDISRALGVSKAAYSLYETGKREPKREMLIQIADFLEVPVIYLIQNNTDEMIKEWINKYPLKKKLYDDAINALNTLILSKYPEYTLCQMPSEYSDTLEKELTEFKNSIEPELNTDLKRCIKDFQSFLADTGMTSKDNNEGIIIDTDPAHSYFCSYDDIEKIMKSCADHAKLLASSLGKPVGIEK